MCCDIGTIVAGKLNTLSILKIGSQVHNGRRRLVDAKR